MSDLQSLVTDQPIMFSKRQSHFPAWGTRHSDANLPVTQDGEQIVSLGVPVTVGMVAPERRWAIQADGELMPQLEFERAHERWYVEHFSLRKQRPDNPSSRPIPCVERFVQYEVDPLDESKYRQIGYDPLKPAPDAPIHRPPEFKAIDPKDPLATQWRNVPVAQSEKPERSDALAKLELLQAQRESGVIGDKDYVDLSAKVLQEAGLGAIPQGGFVDKPEPQPEPELIPKEEGEAPRPVKVEAEAPVPAKRKRGSGEWTEERRQAARDRFAKLRAEGKLGRKKSA